jgi:hypothetical protein
MYLRPAIATPADRHCLPRPTVWAFGACAALSLLLGLFPQPIVRASREAAIAAIATPEPAPEAPARTAERAPARAIR